MKQKVEYWTECVTKVSKAAVRAPQAAFSTMTKSLQCEWEFVQRVVPDCAETFIPLQHAISDQFFPSLLGGVVTVEEKRLFQLPTYLAGLGIYDPTETAVHAYKTSRQGTATVSEAIKGVTAFQHEQHLESLTTARKMSTKAKEDDFILKFEKPVVREADVKNADGGLRLDLGIRGVWQPQVEALFDVKVVDTDAPSHRTRSPEAILESGAKEKKRVYEQAVVERRGNFTPIVLSVDGLLREKPYSQTCGYVRARLAFAIIRATSLCLRGSRVKWRSGLGMDDGAPLYSIL
ncbi:hypothetical protein EMCRGX_G031692 [Ephydatia muelleri]